MGIFICGCGENRGDLFSQRADGDTSKMAALRLCEPTGESGVGTDRHGQQRFFNLSAYFQAPQALTSSPKQHHAPAPYAASSRSTRCATRTDAPAARTPACSCKIHPGFGVWG